MIICLGIEDERRALPKMSLIPLIDPRQFMLGIRNVQSRVSSKSRQSLLIEAGLSGKPKTVRITACKKVNTKDLD